ncbi:glycosyltransferase family 2 protein [Alkalibacterium olivapovliticus]|uniref:Glycosyltransferase involved in cell wall biosynthesis n=1 Tax=Alkalibacterium olivapovliticus TaxID=99907 RepID=A0A2T0W7H3_9LACT|nr:glycosyltransferase family 2 protein [Alkalibacterium olivapovliticus]PRY82464.1 glycosyltransferase involved in cell wall biosynthesis [Alkalibacterium olivapovliticus]
MTAISIIMPVYDVEKYVKKAIDTILNQTYDDFELIIVNDGTRDNSMMIVDTFAKSDNRIKIINQENRGLSAARNAGIKVARGDYICFIDSDDEVNNQMLMIVMNELLTKQPDVLMFGMYIEKIIANEKKIDTLKLNSPRKECTRKSMKDIVLDDTLIELIGYSTNKMYKRKTITTHNILFNEKIELLEDINFNEKIFRVTDKFMIIEDCLYHYKRRNRNSLVNTFQLHYYDLQMAGIHSRRQIFESWGIDEQTIESLIAKLHIRAIRGSCSNLFVNLNRLSFKEKCLIIDLILHCPLTIARIKQFPTASFHDIALKLIIKRKKSLTLAIISFLYSFNTKNKRGLKGNHLSKLIKKGELI